MPSIPDSKTIVNLLLSRTQKKTPTIVHRQFSIQKIRQFYIRKLKFFSNYFNFFIKKIIKEFPLIDRLHPFFYHIVNILFNRDNYKIALNHLNSSILAITAISINYLKLLKYGTSLYSCKHLKKSALGKMCNYIYKLQNSLLFLEKIRLQMKKIPKIDPHRKTILVAGSAGTGKSSFLNKFTRANVTVKNEWRSSKCLLMGHLVYKFFQWQVIDTPALKNSNFFLLDSIEIQSIIAFLNLDCSIIYIIDFNPKSKTSIEEQIQIFIKMRKFIKKKKKRFFSSKTDLGWEKYISFKEKTFISFFFNHSKNSNVISKISFHDEIGLLDVREIIFSFKINNVKLKKKNLNAQNRSFVLTPFISTKIFPNGDESLLSSVNRTLINKLISPEEVRSFYYKTNLSQKKKNFGLVREEKIREFLYEKKFAIKKIRNLRSWTKCRNNIKVFAKEFDCLILSQLSERVTIKKQTLTE